MPSYRDGEKGAEMHKAHRQRWRRLVPVALVTLVVALAASLGLASSAAAASTISGHVRKQESGHIQEAWSRLDKASSSLTQVTHTQSYTWFGGFRGGSLTILKDKTGEPIWVTQLQRYGVNGTVFGNSDRWDVYTESIPAGIVASTVSIEPQVVWAPGWRSLRWAYDALCRTLNLPCPPFPE
jgi:hypothetical protein